MTCATIDIKNDMIDIINRLQWTQAEVVKIYEQVTNLIEEIVATNVKKPYEETQDTESISKYSEDPKEQTNEQRTAYSTKSEIDRKIETTTGTLTGYF